MKYNSEIHHLRSIRLKGYDYSEPGDYFVTVCTKGFKCLFGDVVDGEVVLNKVGEATRKSWMEIPRHFLNIELDEFSIMPNHVHGIITIIDNDQNCRGVQLNAPTENEYFSKISPKKNTLGVIVRTFKGSVKKWCNENCFKHFQWQRNYYEYIIRGEKDLDRIRDYIVFNPGKWGEDRNNSKNI